MEKVKKEYVRFHGDSDPLLYFVDGWVYEKLGESHGLWRVIDETNDDYLYGPRCFEVIEMSDDEFKARKEKQAKIKKLWSEVLALYSKCKVKDDAVKEYFDTDSVKMLNKKKRVLQALIDGKKPKEIGQDYWDVLELKKK